MGRLAVDIFALDGIHHRAHDTVVLALVLQLRQYFLAFGDEREVRANHAWELRHLVVGQVGLAGMQSAPHGRAVILTGDEQRAHDTQMPVAADEGVGGSRHQSTAIAVVVVGHGGSFREMSGAGPFGRGIREGNGKRRAIR